MLIGGEGERCILATSDAARIGSFRASLWDASAPRLARAPCEDCGDSEAGGVSGPLTSLEVPCTLDFSPAWLTGVSLVPLHRKNEFGALEFLPRFPAGSVIWGLLCHRSLLPDYSVVPLSTHLKHVGEARPREVKRTQESHVQNIFQMWSYRV